ncbi:HP1 family phage holin [Shewanella xiamenensis]|uniref:HP1 family phage holin n=1 Tax=Shewanella xiamenensis TaxID=332186 RepID=UPI00313EFD16
MSNPYINDITTQKSLTFSAYVSSLMSTIGGALTLNQIAILLGIFFALITMLANVFYQDLRSRREQRQADKDEQRKQELHRAEMQLKAALLKQVDEHNGPHSTPRDSACSAE